MDSGEGRLSVLKERGNSNKNTGMVCTWFYEHPYCTNDDILFHLLRTNVLIVSLFGLKRLINALNVIGAEVRF